MHGIRRKRDGFAVGLEPQERDLLRDAAAALEAAIAADTATPRLFPAAYRDDDEAAAEYERLVRPSLEAGKLAALRTLRDTAGAARLDDEEAQTWLAALNDLRLDLGTRIDVREEDGLERMHDPGYAVYVWLTWLQSELLTALGA